MLHVRVPAGIGDISWIWSKLSNLNQQIDVFISKDEPKRSLDFVKLLPNVVQARYDTANFHDIVDHCVAPDTHIDEFLKVSSTKYVNLAANRFLESGNRLEYYLPSIPTDFHYPLATTQRDVEKASQILMPGKIPIGIYTSNYTNICTWNAWHLSDWKNFIQEFYNNVPDSYFVFVGAPYDRDFTLDLSKLIRPIPHVNICGETSCAEIVEVIRLFKYFVSYPCGLAILADVVNTPVMMFYPKHLRNLIQSWPDPYSIERNRYKGCEFPRVDDAINWLFADDKFNTFLEEEI